MNLSTFFIKNYYKIQKKINSLPLIPRLGVLLGAMLVILLVWYLLVQLPITRKKAALNTKIQNIITESSSAKLEIDQVIEKITGKKIEVEKQELSAEAKETEKYLGVLDDEITSADEMSKVLRNVLTQEKGLTLVSFKIYPKKILVNAGAAANNGIQLYEQDVKLELSGDYFSTLDYMKRLEALPWRFFWDDIQYEVTNYPNADITIKLHTLGQ